MISKVRKKMMENKNNFVKEITCIPFNEEHIADKCVCCGKEAKYMVVWGRQY
jgi:prolyl-tRNA synthetase